MNLFAQPGVSTAILFIVLFSIVWCGVVAGISLLGGWHELAKRFRAEPTTFRIAEANDGRRFRCATMSTGPKHFPSNYGNCLTIRLGGEGIDIKVWPMFRVLHPPLHIPWQDVDRCERESFLIAFSRTTVYLKDQRHPLRFYGAAGREVLAAWSRRAAPT